MGEQKKKNKGRKGSPPFAFEFVPDKVHLMSFRFHFASF